jgi:hypothetical protein
MNTALIGGVIVLIICVASLSCSLLLTNGGLGYYFTAGPGKPEECEKCPLPAPCPECKQCPDCPICPIHEDEWKKFDNTNAVSGIVVPPNNTMPTGIKHYGQFNTSDECESQCKNDQPFCHAWTHYPDVANDPYSKACYGRDDSHFIAQHQPNVTSGVKRSVSIMVGPPLQAPLP